MLHATSTTHDVLNWKYGEVVRDPPAPIHLIMFIATEYELDLIRMAYPALTAAGITTQSFYGDLAKTIYANVFLRRMG